MAQSGPKIFNLPIILCLFDMNLLYLFVFSIFFGASKPKQITFANTIGLTHFQTLLN